jgi:hypothetical protein
MSEESSGGRTHGDSVTVVVVNWNSGLMLRDCLLSLVADAEADRSSTQVIVVDNASTDSSVERAAEVGHADILRNSVNRGFAAACNQGAALVQSDFLLFLNPDCRVGPGAIAACRRRLQEDSSVGVVGVALTGDDGRVSRSCHRFPTVSNFLFKLSGLSAVSKRFPDGSMREWAHDADRRVDHVIGAFYMVRTDEFRALGGFDERFFVYLEDLDLSLRYRALGKHCMFLASCPSFHKGGGTSEQAKATRLFYATRSRILYAFKHFGRAQAWLHLLATMTAEPLARIARGLARRQWRSIIEVGRAFSMLYGDLPATLHLARRP